MRLFCKLMLSVLLAASVARAQTPSTDAPAKAEPATPAVDSAQAAAKVDAPRPYVESALTFLRAFTHTNRTGPEGEKAWAELRSVSADKEHSGKGKLKLAEKDGKWIVESFEVE